MSNAVKQTRNIIGRGKAGPGRPKGSLNKHTTTVKAALHEAFERRGGVSALVEWADRNPTEFYRLYARLIPTERKVPDPVDPRKHCITVRFVKPGEVGSNGRMLDATPPHVRLPGVNNGE